MAVTDTDPQASAILAQGFRRMSPVARLQMAARMSDEVRDLARTGIRHRHPGYSAQETEDALAALLFGEDLFHRIHPDRRFVAP
jgi:hypothetical protein